jgi:hypothetical protein
LRYHWIKQQQKRLRGQERETLREYVDRESHKIWGRRYLLKVLECDESASIELKGRQMLLRVRPGADRQRRHDFLEGWYREQIRGAAPDLVMKWERRMGVRVNGVFVQRMKTKWGSCNPRSRTIRLNTE